MAEQDSDHGATLFDALLLTCGTVLVLGGYPTAGSLIWAALPVRLNRD
ncbi:MAG: hypothetical protein J07HB67_00371 [halophilic archaeon J07HB67]|nr:MAG: hypothetical protein J07HB67_00371 [halophilic archaeon J07HB67]